MFQPIKKKSDIFQCRHIYFFPLLWCGKTKICRLIVKNRKNILACGRFCIMHMPGAHISAEVIF